MVQQTVSFEMRVYFRQIERPSHLPESVLMQFDTLEEMLERYSKERRRRALADRATSARYRQVLTSHGYEMLNSDDPHYSKERYADAINETWFSL